MKTIKRENIPKDFIYYRSASKVFYEYYKNHKYFVVKKTNNKYEFIKACKIFWNAFWSVIAEKTDIEPTKEMINSMWIKHAIVHRTPLRETKKPKWWWRVPTFITKDFIHSSRSAFCILENEKYRNKWSSKAKWHRNKILKLKSDWILKIDKCDDLDKFLKIYSSLKLKDPNHKWLINWCNNMFHNKNANKNFSIFLASINNKILAWWVFIQEWVTSEYFTSFYTQESKPYHLWVAIMDAWFEDSYKSWIKYCDLDHMRDSWQSSWYAWYTKFKESIAEFDVYFHDMWVKIF